MSISIYPPTSKMISLDSLATELLVQIVDYISPLGDLNSDSDFPTLKNLSLTCHRLHSICFHPLFASIRLELEYSTSTTTITRLRDFVRTHQLQPTITHVTINFEHNWNESKNGLELKKLLWELRASSLTLSLPRPASSVREKCAKWSYNLDTLQALKVSLLDDDNELKMLLLRVCPVRLLVVEDGCFRLMYESDDAHFHHSPTQCPGVALMKPGIFPNLARVVYSAAWPSYHRFDNFLGFVCRLPVLRELGITLMGGQDEGLNLGREGYRWSGDSVRYREIVAEYALLTRKVERSMEGLRVIRIGDIMIPWKEVVGAPMGWREDVSGQKGDLGGDWNGVGVWRKMPPIKIETVGGNS
ncbi:uncharacterized protein H6S33_011545 [Morchella sextelata]|uniref:uncharacterized protein n=1 Tax=Morchella sextelata TaxID=1174677 RepID=UPI001D044D8D|nr:uncharacterized protein H6S33_011545 [Morchella sextelata]KAH0611118.1 hypothetical protein H6S33_011545 [Morchella sextelata]